MLTKLSPGEQPESKTKPKFSCVVAKASKENGERCVIRPPQSIWSRPCARFMCLQVFPRPLATTLQLIPTGGGFGSSRLGVAALCFPATGCVTEPKARVLQVAKQNPIKRLG